MAAFVRRSPRVAAAQQAECHGSGDGAAVPGRDGNAGHTRDLNVSRCKNVGAAPSDDPGKMARKTGLNVSLLSDNDRVTVLGETRERTVRRALQAAPSGQDLGRAPNTEGTETEYECGVRNFGETPCPREESQGKAPALVAPSTDSRTRTPPRRGVGTPVQAGGASSTPETTGVIWRSPARVLEVPGPSSASPARVLEVPGPSSASPARVLEVPGPSSASPARVLEVPGPSSASPARVLEVPGPSSASPARVLEVPGPSSASSARVLEMPGPHCEKELNAHIAPGSSCESGASAPVAALFSEIGTTSSVPAGTSIEGHAQDHRVRCFSKERVQDILEMCTEFLKELLESQECLSPDQRAQELKNCIWNFQTSFQENVVVNGQSWHEASEIQNESDLKILEDRLDDLVVDTTRKRKFHPRKIVSQVMKMLKTERDILEQYKPVVAPEECKLDAGLVSQMADLSVVTSTVSKQIGETMKGLPSHTEKAAGFSQVLSIQPMLEDSRIRREIFSCQVKLDDLARSPAKRVETNPSGNPSPPKPTPFLKRKRPQSPSQQRLYPLRGKSKISLVT